MTLATTTTLLSPDDGVARAQVASSKRRCPIVIFPSLARLSRA
jgi:hypothetical protein